MMGEVLEKMLCGIMTANEMQFGFMSEKGTIDAVFVFRRLQKKYSANGKKVVYAFCGLRESF